MLLGQLFPLVVTLKEEGKPLVKKNQFMPDGSAPMITVCPIIPGAQVTPVNIDVGGVPGSEAAFSVVPLTRGKLPNAHVEFRSGGKVIGSVALAMRAGTRRLTKFLAFLTIALPCLLLYMRMNPMEEFEPETPKEGVGAKAVEPGTPTPGQPAVRPQGGPGGAGRPNGGGGPGGGRPGGANGNRGSGSQPLPQPPAGETPKKDKDAETPKKDGESLEIALFLQQPESGAAKEKKEQDKPADSKKPAADDKKPADDEKKPEQTPPGERRAPPQMPQMTRQPPGMTLPVRPPAENGHMQYYLRRTDRDALEYWIHKKAKQIHYPHKEPNKDGPAANTGGEVHIGDSGDALYAGVCWLNYDAFTWLNKEKLPDWSFTYCFDYVLGDRWKPDRAVSSIYGQILESPFLELFTLCALFVLTLLVRFIQDPKRRTATGTAFAA
jgi:hypothetical protein